MNLKIALLAPVALASTLALHTGAGAQEITPWPEMMMQSADTNHDGIVTRAEYLDAMARIWDEKHAQMMKSDAQMKGGEMNKSQFMQFTRTSFAEREKGR